MLNDEREQKLRVDAFIDHQLLKFPILHNSGVEEALESLLIRETFSYLQSSDSPSMIERLKVNLTNLVPQERRVSKVILLVPT